MKCPHCNTSIPDAFSTQNFWQAPEVHSREGNFLAHAANWSAVYQRCPECHEGIIYLKRAYAQHIEFAGTLNQKRHYHPQPTHEFLAFPKQNSRPIPAEVTAPYREDFEEACAVLPISPKASAALSRRLLQAILRDKAATTKKDLYDQIEEVLTSGKLPSHISGGLHAVRHIGNFAAHTMKSTATGVILDVEPGEAEWNLDVLESLFDFYFVAPATDAKRKTELNAKLTAAGKPPIP
jgi:hypothetical protein